MSTGTICSPGWDYLEAEVVCRQLGYGSQVQANTGRFSTRAPEAPVWQAYIYCSGTEQYLSDCSNSGWSNTTQCYSYRDAGVTCESMCVCVCVCVCVWCVCVCMCVCVGVVQKNKKDVKRWEAMTRVYWVV